MALQLIPRPVIFSLSAHRRSASAGSIAHGLTPRRASLRSGLPPHFLKSLNAWFQLPPGMAERTQTMHIASR